MYDVRHCLMEDTRVACTEHWLIRIGRGNRWFSLYAQEKTKQWDPQKICLAEKSQGSILTSHGQICTISHRSITELMLLPSKASSNGFALPGHPMTCSSLITLDASALLCIFLSLPLYIMPRGYVMWVHHLFFSFVHCMVSWFCKS